MGYLASNCQFYGKHAVPDFSVLAENKSAECPILSTMADAFCLCLMEAHGRLPDWSVCPVNVPGRTVELATEFLRYKILPAMRPM
jgi:hypothetical protein